MPDGSAVLVLKPGRTALSSAWEGERLLDGFASIGRVEAELSKAQDDPMDRPRQFEKARHHYKHQWFVREIIKQRFNFFHYGFRIGTEEGGKPSPKIKQWEANNRKNYRRYARDAWLEWLIIENVVGLWRTAGGKPPLVFPPEKCEFTDFFGNEIIKLRHDLSTEHVTTIGAFSRAELTEFTRFNNELKLDHNNKFFGFDILRRERVGNGFGVPALSPIFITAAQINSLEVSDAQLAAACRTVYEQHKMGHEIKSGIHAGSKAHFWNEGRAKAFETSIKGKTGHIKITTNFDHEIVYPRPDPKFFDEKRYASGISRLALWSMPIGQMLLSKTINPFFLTMLKFQAVAEREYLAEHLKTVFVQALGAPADIKPIWSNRCFADPRIAADLTKNGLAAGPLSQGSFLEEAGFDPEEERERKAMEADLPKGQTTPIYDAAHGPPKKPAGRKPGTKNGEGA
jgi:hypothetical protein